VGLPLEICSIFALLTNFDARMIVIIANKVGAESIVRIIGFIATLHHIT